MRKTAINIMATTGISLVTLAIIATFYGARFMFISSVFQTLAANIIIHLGYLLTQRFESEYVALEVALDIGYTTIVLILFGAIFNWFASTPIWMLIVMAVVIYIMGMFLSIFRIREEINTINELLQKRNSSSSKEEI